MVSINTEMECDETNERQSSVDKIEVEKDDSADKFQKFIYDLFDKNGILNDLRAYLRGHIVNILKSAHTGDPPPCQKNFTQRLELVSQALNILIAEYLLQLDFKYTLSVFVSEIPLSNMIFDFAKALLKDNMPAPNLKFKDSDVWLVLNYLGVKCDSEHASNIVEMYKGEERTPLLFCLLKCMPMYRKESIRVDEENSSRDSLTSSANSLDTVEKKAKVHRNTSCHHNCRHYAFCKSCQHRFARLKEKYKERKKDIHKEARRSSESPVNVESFVKNINVMEKRIINEMFSQLHSVYEAEVELVRQEEESRVRRTLATHALELQQQREEIEESLKSKQAELESSAQHKKQFLWGVARTLRDQHEHVARAMTLLKDEQEALAQQEDNLKAQLLQAEATLRSKGEEMRVQIAKELEILEGHLESMKRERDSLNKERSDLEQLKLLCDSKTRLIETSGEREKEDLKQHYDVLKNEIAALKKYIESNKTPSKCLIERSTLTDLIEVPSNTNILNNTSGVERCKPDVSAREAPLPHQLVNDLKKQRNVNFSQGAANESNLDERYREVTRERSRESASSEEARASGRDSARERDTIQRLMEENESLRDYARQQREHISALWSAAPRPRTAPLLPAANYCTVHRVHPSSSANTFGWRKGAGEELSLFPAERPRLPTEPSPFLGMLRDRHPDNRRHLINQWRALKRRASPLARINKPRPPIAIQRGAAQLTTSPSEFPASGFPAVRIADDTETSRPATVDTRQAEGHDEQETPATKTKVREKSPKTVLKEAKENLRNNSIKEKAPLQKRDKSPNSMLREAKLRLRKLEIEAEAVEKSYLDFRKRQTELREERRSLSMLTDHQDTDLGNNLGVSRSGSYQKFCNKNEINVTAPSNEADDLKKDFDKYLRDYQTTFDIGETYFKNKNTAREKAKPIPIAFSEVNPKKDKRKNVDYLATPMMEFRKLYHAEKERNLSQLKTTATKSGAGNIYNKVVGSKEDLNNKKTEHEIPKNVNGQNLEDTKHEIRDKKYDEIDKNEITVNETEGSKKPKDTVCDFDPKFEEKSNTEEQMILEYKLERLRKIKGNKAVELEILKENINKIYNFKSPRSTIVPVEETADEVSSRANLFEIVDDKDKQPELDDKNILRVEIENSYEVNKVKISDSQEGELVIVVQSSVTTRQSESEQEAVESTPITVNISPKTNSGPNSFNTETNRADSPQSRRSVSPEKAAQLTRNDVLNAIFHAEDAKNVSSVDMHLELSKDNDHEEFNVVDKDGDDYPDDFSADVDNYNSRSEYGNNSPISLAKSDNDNFWDN